MIISSSLADSLKNDLFRESTRYVPGINSQILYYNDHKVFKRFLEITVSSNGECFIPIVAVRKVMECMDNWVTSNSDCDSVKISIPLYVGGVTEKKTAEPLIKTICNCTSTHRLIGIHTSSGLSYYGGNGLIFDKRWNPLMMCGYMISINKKEHSCTINRPICYISPDVFNTDDLLSRAIIRKVIPFLSIYGIYQYRLCLAAFGGTITARTVEIIVRYFNEYFTVPSAVKDPETMNESIWEFLDTLNDKFYENEGILHELVESH